MTNTFTLVLVVMTLITGLLWCFNKFVFSAKKNGYHLITTLNSNRFYFKKKIIETASSIFPTLIIVLIIRSFIYEPFQIPSGSMMPTLLVGDFILVEKFSYGIKDPLYQKTLIETNYPKRGDIIVFKYPKDPRLSYIKRVVGLPNDKIIYNLVMKEITIYPRFNYQKKYINTLPIKYSNIKPSDFIQFFLSYNNKKASNSSFKLSKNTIKKNVIHLFERKEILGNITHRIIITPNIQDQLKMYYQQPDQKEVATWVVPPKHYFVMGDNRDNSLDSRYWGFVPESNLIGKATIIWMSLEKQENKWITSLRLNRIGRIY